MGPENCKGGSFMKRLFVVSLILVLAIGLALSDPAMAQQKKRFFGIGTGGVGGVYYPLGGGPRPGANQ